MGPHARCRGCGHSHLPPLRSCVRTWCAIAKAGSNFDILVAASASSKGHHPDQKQWLLPRSHVKLVQIMIAWFLEVAAILWLSCCLAYCHHQMAILAPDGCSPQPAQSSNPTHLHGAGAKRIASPLSCERPPDTRGPLASPKYHDGFLGNPQSWVVSG